MKERSLREESRSVPSRRGTSIYSPGCLILLGVSVFAPCLIVGSAIWYHIVIAQDPGWEQVNVPASFTIAVFPGSVLCCAGLALLRVSYRTRRLIKKGVVTTATVVKNEPVDTGLGMSNVATVEFWTTDMSAQKFQMFLEEEPREIGSQIEVMYDPQHPEVNIIRAQLPEYKSSHNMLYFEGMLFLSIGVIWTLLPWIL